MTDTLAQPPLARHDSKLLDLAFGMDTTGSMSSYIKAACDNIRQIVEEIVAKESSDVRLALVEYRDHPPQDNTYVTQVHDFTPRVAEMKRWLEASKADGGGDAPEAVADCLHQLLKLSWRPEATKICVLISDAPPHGLNAYGDGFPDGCPDGLDPMTIARQLAEKGVTLYVAGCEPAIVRYKDFFTALAYVTGGQYVPLQAARALTPVIVGGAQEELSLEQWMEQVNQQVMMEVQARGADNLDVEHLSRKVMDDLKIKGAKSRQLKVNKMAQAPVSDYVRSMAACADMGAVKTSFQSATSAGFSRVERDSVDMCYERSSPRHESMCSMMAPPPPPAAPMMMGRHSSPPARSSSRPVKKGALRSATYLEAYEEVADAIGDAVYETEEGDIHYGQAERMVQKALMRNNVSLPKK